MNVKKRNIFWLLSTVFVFIAGLLVYRGLSPKPLYARQSQLVKADQNIRDNEDDILIVAQSVAESRFAQGYSTSELRMVSAKIVEADGWVEALGAEDWPLTRPGAIRGMWVITFTGEFDPRHGPPGIPRPTLHVMSVYINGIDGSIIGIGMTNKSGYRLDVQKGL